MSVPSTPQEPPPWTLGLFAKEPRPGHVKSRLAATTSAQWAAQVADAFLRDLVERLATVQARRVLSFAPAEAQPYFATVARERFVLRQQCEGDLGQRMADFFQAELQAGMERVVLLGTDSPTVPRAFVEQAFAELECADVVLGPAADGGYYLIGCARRLPPLFEGIEWGGHRVLFDSVARLGYRNWRLGLLPPWYDVDRWEDWWTLRGHLLAMRRAGFDPELPHTERLAAAGNYS